jgi:solute carrier family 35 protein F5
MNTQEPVEEPQIPVPVTEQFTISDELAPSIMGQRPRRSVSSSRASGKHAGFRASIGLGSVARRTLGIFLLLVTVFLWTGSNFLASVSISCKAYCLPGLTVFQSIFADDTYSKPYFVTYINTAFFAVSLLPVFLKIAHQRGYKRFVISVKETLRGRLDKYRTVMPKAGREEEEASEENDSSVTRLLIENEAGLPLPADPVVRNADEILTVRETAWLSLEFCGLWFLANYFVAACLTYTSVASSTILTSTSSIWTLIFGALVRVESFSFRKLFGVLASLAGIILISSVDLSGDNDENRGSFPHKSQHQIAIGDAMAFFSAVMYGVYTVVMKKRIGNEDRVNMPLFFGMVGLFNVIFLSPGFILLHLTGIETFELPPTGKILTIVLVCIRVVSC